MSSEAEHFPYFSPTVIGQSFDMVRDETMIQAPENLTCEWYHSPYDSDLIVWTDVNGIYVRLHFCFSGLTLDWDLMNGTQTGYIVEQIGESLTHSIFGEISYDKTLSRETQARLIAIVDEIHIIEDETREKIIEYFQKSPTFDRVVGEGQKSRHYWHEFVGLLRNFFAN